MARIRTIKPEFWQDEKLSRLPYGARLLFIGLWNIADDVGRLRGNPLFVAAQTFPYDTAPPIEQWLQLLHSGGFIERYVNDGESFIVVVNFLKHQQISKPTPSRIPAPDDSGSAPVGLPEASGETPSGKERKGKERIREGKGSGAPPARSDGSIAVFGYWQQIHQHPRAKLDNDLAGLIDDSLKTYSVDDLRLAIDGCKASPHHMGQNDRKTVYDSLELILRDVNRFIGYAEKKGKALIDVTRGIQHVEDQGWEEFPVNGAAK